MHENSGVVGDHRPRTAAIERTIEWLALGLYRILQTASLVDEGLPVLATAEEMAVREAGTDMQCIGVNELDTGLEVVDDGVEEEQCIGIEEVDAGVEEDDYL